MSYTPFSAVKQISYISTVGLTFIVYIESLTTFYKYAHIEKSTVWTAEKAISMKSKLIRLVMSMRLNDECLMLRY